MSTKQPTQYEKQFAELGITLYQAEGKTRAKVMCIGDCGGSHDTAVNGNLPPAGLASNFRRAGWNDRARKWTCPSCQTPRLRARLQTERDKDRMTPEKAPAFITRLPPRPAPSITEVIDRVTAHNFAALTVAAAAEPEVEPIPDGPPDMRTQLRVIGRLNQFFFHGHFQTGWSDERIATELDLAPATVRSIREASIDHGPLQGDPELDNVRNELLVLRAMLDEKLADLDRLQARYAAA